MRYIITFIMTVAALIAPLSLVTSIVAPRTAHAAGHNCADGTMPDWRGLQMYHLYIYRHCQTSYSQSPTAVNGVAYQREGRFEMKVGSRANEWLVWHISLHEATHVAEYYMRWQDRRAVYKALGYNVSGTFNSVPTYVGPRSGSWTTWPEANKRAWGRSPRERLAEATAYCYTGMTSNRYINPRPKVGCAKFLYQMRGAVARAKR